MVGAILARTPPPDWVQADVAGMGPRERQAAAKRVGWWLLHLLNAEHPEYDPHLQTTGESPHTVTI